MRTFQNIPSVITDKALLEVAFSRARRMVNKAHPRDTKIDAKKRKEVEKITTINEILVAKLAIIISSFPSFDDLSPYYRDLCYATLDVGELKHSLGAVQWAQQQVTKFSSMYCSMLKQTQEARKVGELSRAYYGRIASVIKRISSELLELENARRTLKTFPTIKEGFTVCIVGFPNVGKSTLLKRLTGSKVEVEAYAFTTKTINIGYAEGVQLIDTPGSLNRPAKMNLVEKEADLAMKHLANAFISVIDLTETYSLEEQLTLHRKVLAYKKPTVVYLSKTDLLPPEAVKGFSIAEKVFTHPDNLKAWLRDRV
ncbi:MAG: GTPase [Nanoarchaeota archaeon]